MSEPRYRLTDRTEQIMDLVDRMLAMPQEDRLDFAQDLHCSSQYFFTGEDDMEGMICLVQALEKLVAVSPVQIGVCDVN